MYDYASLFNPGILRDTLIPNLQFQTSLLLPLSLPQASPSIRSYLIPAAQLATVWFNVTRRYPGTSISTVVKQINRVEWLILIGVSLWGAQSIHRALTPLNTADARIHNQREDRPWWKSVLAFIPETVFQSIISLYFTAPLSDTGIYSYPAFYCPPGLSGWLEGIAIGMFGTGLALGFTTDRRLRSRKGVDQLDVGTWGTLLELSEFASFLVRDSIPLLLYSHDLLHPLLFLLSPLTRYGFQTKHSVNQEYKEAQLFEWASTDPARYTDYLVYEERKKNKWEFRGLEWVGPALGFGVGALVLERLATTVSTGI